MAGSKKSRMPMKPGSPMDREMERKMGITPGSPADRKMERGSRKRPKGGK